MSNFTNKMASIQQTPAVIFKSNQRGMEMTGTCKRFCYLSYGKYVSNFKALPGIVLFLNDEFLSSPSSELYVFDSPITLLIIPIMGSLTYQNADGTEGIVLPEEIRLIQLAARESLIIKNTQYQEVNFLLVGLQPTFSQPRNTIFKVAFKQRNSFTPVAFENAFDNRFKMNLAVFEGRAENNYVAEKENNTFFILVLNGAFEAEGRLLESRDGLALWNIKTIQMEALANNSLVLLMEFPGTANYK